MPQIYPLQLELLVNIILCLSVMPANLGEKNRV